MKCQYYWHHKSSELKFSKNELVKLVKALIYLILFLSIISSFLGGNLWRSFLKMLLVRRFRFSEVLVLVSENLSPSFSHLLVFYQISNFLFGIDNNPIPPPPPLRHLLKKCLNKSRPAIWPPQKSNPLLKAFFTRHTFRFLVRQHEWNVSHSLSTTDENEYEMTLANWSSTFDKVLYSYSLALSFFNGAGAAVKDNPRYKYIRLFS